MKRPTAAGTRFPSESRLGGATPMSGWSQMMTRLRQVSGVEGVGLHDLRRTYRSALADLGVREEIAEAMIAHRRSGLVARYNRAEFWDPAARRGRELDAWLAESSLAPMATKPPTSCRSARWRAMR